MPEVAVALRPLIRDHAAALFPTLSQAQMYRFVDDDPPTSAQALAERLGRWEARRSPDRSELWLNWAVLVGPGPTPGSVGGYVQATVPVAGPAQIGYMISPGLWGQGVGGRAVRLLLHELATRWGVSQVHASVDPRNQRSVRLLESVGMSLLFTDPEGATLHGRVAPESHYAMTLRP